MTIKIAVLPKCYIDDIVHGRGMDVFTWIEMARQLGAEGLEMYHRFFVSLDDAYIDTVGEAIQQAGFEMPMLCCSPDFTDPDPARRRQAIDREIELIRITRRLGGPGATCRVLSGQRRPQVSVEQGLEWVIGAINELLPVAWKYDVVLGIENHYKDGYWEYPEFAQRQDVFLRILDAIPDREHFGVQYDPSNALVAGDDPVELLRRVVDRVVSIHASDRHLIVGATLADLSHSDGALGDSFRLRHGVVGKGANDYDAIFATLAGAGYDRWISVEDGEHGMEEMRESIQFLMYMRDKYFTMP